MPPKHHPDVIAALSDLYIYVSMQRNPSWIHNSNYKTHLQHASFHLKDSSALLSQVCLCSLNMIWENKYNQRSEWHSLSKCTAFYLFEGIYCSLLRWISFPCWWVFVVFIQILYFIS